MIVITRLIETPKFLVPNDEFCLRVSDVTGCEVVITERVTVTKVIDFIASFRFALEDGTCPGFHLTGVFANKAELPKELREAVLIEDLSPEQYANFVRTVGVERPGEEPARMFAKWHGLGLRFAASLPTG